MTSDEIIKENGTIKINVEYKVTKLDITTALKGNNVFINTATATLNNRNYTDTDKTDGVEGTIVKQKVEYTIQYYFNNVHDKSKDYTNSTIVGATIDGFKKEFTDYTYIKYVGIDGKENGSNVAVKGNNIIKVYYGKPEITISKKAPTTVKAGNTILYTINVANNGDIDTNVIVKDDLIDTKYINSTSKINKIQTNPTIVNNNNKHLEWNLELKARTTKSITFEAETPRDSFGKNITNTANVVDNKNVIKTSNIVKTKVEEINIKYNEWLEGQKGEDLNITFILDNSSSMNRTIEGKTFTHSSDYVSPFDVDKTRIDNAKKAIEKFITNEEGTKTSMSVITFNKSSNGIENKMKTLIKDEDIFEKEIKKKVWVDAPWNGHYETKIIKEKYANVNGVDLPVNNKTKKATDGKEYHYVYETINTGAHDIGNNSVSNTILKQKVDNISITSEKSGFGTYVNPAFNLINNNKTKYVKENKKNIVIVLADGAFSDNYESSLAKLKKNVDAIYCIGFGSGSEYDANALEKMSTNNKCYSAKDTDTLLQAFKEIKEEAGKEKTCTTEYGIATLDKAKKTIKVSTETPITVSYKDGLGNKQTLFTCTSESQLSQYGLKIVNNQITWNVKEFVKNNPGAPKPMPSIVELKYYIQRN